MTLEINGREYRPRPNCNTLQTIAQAQKCEGQLQGLKKLLGLTPPMPNVPPPLYPKDATDEQRAEIDTAWGAKWQASFEDEGFQAKRDKYYAELPADDGPLWEKFNRIWLEYCQLIFENADTSLSWKDLEQGDDTRIQVFFVNVLRSKVKKSENGQGSLSASVPVTALPQN